MTTPFPPIFDGHNDTLLNLYLPERGENRSFFERSEKGHIDLPRAQAGGLGGGLFAIFVPDPTLTKGDKPPVAMAAVDPDYIRQTTDAMIDALFALEAAAKGQMQVVRTAAELAGCLDNGILAAVLHFEDAGAIAADLGNLEAYYERGLRSVGITWSRPNAFGHGVPFKFNASPDTGPGLTPAGQALVRRCNELGVLVDLSHLNEKGFWDVARLSTAPLVATHSAAHTLAPSTRNLTDRQIDAIGASGGLIGINFHVGFLRADGRRDQETSLLEIVRHLDYIANRIGIEHVALGSDFDGARMPDDLKDAAGLPRLMNALREHGYDDDALAKIAQQNWLRLLAATWRSAK